MLVVDDHEDLRTLLRYMFELESDVYGHVWEAEDGEEALRMARRYDPDLVILDVAMPRMDGLTALPHLRRLLPGSRIVVYTGSYPEDVAERAAEAGANAVMTKNVPPETFHRKLAEVLERPPGRTGREHMLVLR